MWQDVELPENFYKQQNGSMRLIGLWHNTQYGRLGVWIDSDQCLRLQMEGKNKRLISPPLWRGEPEQYPTGRHKLSLHIVLGELTELFIDDQIVVSVEGNNMPYPEYAPNQILFMFDGANANTRAITATCYEIGARDAVDACHDLDIAYRAAVAGREKAQKALDEAYLIYGQADAVFNNKLAEENDALAALEKCKGLK